MSHRLLLVDGHAYAYRAFHAIRSLNAPDGTPTNAIFGFVKMLRKMRESLAPSHIGVIWDGGLSADRLAELPDYKAQRPPMPDSLEQQLDEIVAWLEAARVFSFCSDGVEADDFIAFAARRAVASGVAVVIASSDKDFMQLVSPGIGLFNPNDKTETIWGAAEVRAKAGVAPEQIVDWLSLVGDTVDNIPGVSGVGPKTAAELLERFGSVAVLYQQLDQVASERLRAKLHEAEPAVRRNLRLIRLHEDLPFSFQVGELAARAPDSARLVEMYRRWGFRSLAAAAEAEQGGGLLPGFA